MEFYMKDYLGCLNINRFSKHNSEKLALYIFFILALMRTCYLLYFTVPIFHLQTNELITTAAQNLGILAYDPSNLGSNFYHNIPTFLPKLELISYLLFKDFNVFLYSLSLLNQLCFAFATFAIGKKFSKSNWGGAICFSLCSFSWFTHNTFGYGFIYFAAAVAPGLVFQSIGLAILTLLLYGKNRAAWISIGIVFNFHPVISLILGTITLCYELLIHKQNIKLIAKNILLASLFTLPLVVTILRQTGYTDHSNIDLNAWWEWMHISKSHHIFPWNNLNKLKCFLLYIISSYGICYFAQRNKCTEQGAIYLTLITISIAVFMGCVTYFFTEIVKIPLFGMLMLSRASVFTVPFMLALLTAYLLNSPKRNDTAYSIHPCAIICLLILLMPIRYWDYSARIALMLSLYFLIFLINFNRTKLTVFLEIATILSLTYFLSKSNLHHWQAAQIILSICAGVSLLTSINVLARSIKFTVPFILLGFCGYFIFTWISYINYLQAEIRYDDYMTLTTWIRENTAQNDQLLVPPGFNKIDVASQRLILPDAGLLGISMYKPQLLPIEMMALKTIYSIDFSSEQTRKQLAATGLYPSLLNGFKTLNSQRIKEIKSQYPKLRYIVEKLNTPGYKRLLFQEAYKNKSYILYDITQPIKPSTIQSKLIYTMDFKHPNYNDPSILDQKNFKI